MSVKRVTESYAKGSTAGARKPPQSPGARAQGQTARPPAPKPLPKAPPNEATEAAMAAIAAEIAALHQAQGAETSRTETPAASPTRAAPVAEEVAVAIAEDAPELSPASPIEELPSPSANPPHSEARRPDASPQGESPSAADYREIITNTIASLKQNSAEARQGVYGYAREIVRQRLLAAQPALLPDVIERERAALDRIIEDIEASEVAKQAPPARLMPSKTMAKPARPVAAKRRDVPQAKHFHGGVLRLFAIAGLVCAGLFAYWLIAGRPGIQSAVAYLPPLRGAIPAETPTNDSAPQPAAAETAGATSSPSSDDPPGPPPDTAAETPDAPAQAAPNDSAVNETVRSLAANPLINLNVECGGAPCGTASMPPPTGADSAAWISSYGTIKSPPRPNQANPQNTREMAKLMDAGRAAAAPSATGSYARGMDKMTSGDSEGAIRDFTEAIRLDPNYAEAFLQRGNARFKNGNPDLAITDFSDAIGIDGRNAAAFKARGMARLYNADEDGALDDLTKAIQIAEAEPARLPPADLFFARRTRASIYSRKQMGDRELFDLSAMLDAYWKNPDLADALKTNYGAQGSTALMATIYRQRAALYVARANMDGAIADLSLALQLDPARAIQLVLERARVQEAAGKREQAAADFQRVLQINPRIEEAKQAVARLNAKP